ncbi:hypothetical protein [Mesorhizobium sp. B2-3-4]|uniref:hypothetical protein n=1 Tax=Mesorhizobium sp. B2-3-4 TaxID=2589959 RepID=UPI00112BDD78|nr:hypothetical protein [Mesorhizobium sp. B2-3-4]TPM25727.1 hypothetical protein FJ967_32400 [Mesorhizobium sp. B2-3-4]
MTKKRVLAFLAFIVCLTAVALVDWTGERSTYTLYRNSVTAPMRIHIATFNTSDGEDYNRQNCDIAANLFQAQPGVIVKYWCEKGSYRR